MTAETTAGSSARAERDVSLAQKSDDQHCACGQPLEGFDAQLGQAVCTDCTTEHEDQADAPPCEVGACSCRSRYLLPPEGNLCEFHAQERHPVVTSILCPSSVVLVQDGGTE
jgi:hypothetical protein